MPCTTSYSGVSNAVKTFERTKITCDMIMNDEEGNVLGHIKSAEDFSITATLLDRDGMTELMTKTFFLIEKNSDKAMCKKNGWEGVELKSGQKADETIITVCQEWLTEQYRTYVHSHSTPQDVYTINNNFIA